MLIQHRPAPVVSVVVTTHNALKHLKNALESVYEQDVIGLDLIVVNYRSTDGTTEWLKECAGRRPIRVINTDVPTLAQARNLGIDAAHAPLIAFLNDGDVWRAEKIKRQLSAHQTDRQLIFSFTDFRRLGPKGEAFGTCFAHWGAEASGLAFERMDNPRSTLVGRNLVEPSTVMARRDALLKVRGFNPKLSSGEDWDLWLSLAALGPIAWSGFVGAAGFMRPGTHIPARRTGVDALKHVARRHLPEIQCRWRDRMRLFARLQAGEAEALLQEHHPVAAAAHHLLAGLAGADGRALRRCAADLAHALHA